jgi:hypothetical protein
MINAFLRRTYYLRVGALKQKCEQADIELKKIYETRQALIEKNLSGIYSDDIFKEQNRILEEKITATQATKDETMIEKYNLEAITKFIETKFTSLDATYQNAPLEQKRVLMFDISKRFAVELSGLLQHPNQPFLPVFLGLSKWKCLNWCSRWVKVYTKSEMRLPVGGVY